MFGTLSFGDYCYKCLRIYLYTQLQNAVANKSWFSVFTFMGFALIKRHESQDQFRISLEKSWLTTVQIVWLRKCLICKQVSGKFLIIFFFSVTHQWKWRMEKSLQVISRLQQTRYVPLCLVFVLYRKGANVFSLESLMFSVFYV